jgi:hypothetical protein
VTTKSRQGKEISLSGTEFLRVVASNQASFAGGTGGTSPERKSDRGVKLATTFHLLPKLRIRGAMPPVPHYVYGLMLNSAQREPSFS